MYVPGWIILYVAVALVGAAVWIVWLLARGKRGE
jgi:hypothetical protein